MKRIKVLIVAILCLSLSGCSFQKKTKEIVLYIESNSEGWLRSEQLYEELESDRIDAFNLRLDELDTGLKLVVKAFPPCMERETCGLVAKELVTKDKTADIVVFNEFYVSDLEPLHSYFESEEGKEVLTLLSSERIKTLNINKELYHMPKMNYPLITPQVYIDASYYERHRAELDLAKQDGMALLAYFRDQYEEQQDWLLFDHISIDAFIGKEYQPITNTPLFIRKQDGKVVNPYEEEPILNIMRVMAELRWKGYTGKNLEHEKLEEISKKQNFILGDGMGLSERVIPSSTQDVKLDLGPEYYSYETGFSILKQSDQKEAAFQLLAIMNTDEKSSSILQFGAEPKRNSEGKIVDPYHTQGGSFNNLGNNLIIESSEQEIDQKLSTFQALEKTSDVHQYPLFPSVFDLTNVANTLDTLEEVMLDSPFQDTSVLANLACTVHKDVQDPDTFMKEIETINQKLKQAGIDDVIEQLQEQIDGWK